MEEHLNKLLSDNFLRQELINDILINPITFKFKDNINEEYKWVYYNWVCKELQVPDKIYRLHGMSSDVASMKKLNGHKYEEYFEKFGLTVQKGTLKNDLLFNGKEYASLKSGTKIQWGMHIITNLPKEHKNVFYKWTCSFNENSVYFKNRTTLTKEIIEKLSNKNYLYSLINYFFRKEENIPYFIILNHKENIFYRVKYDTLINTIVDNTTFRYTKLKKNIVGSINLYDETKPIFKFELRKDKNQSILLHGTSKSIIELIKYYKIPIEQVYENN